VSKFGLVAIGLLCAAVVGPIAAAPAAPCKEAAEKNAICIELAAELVLTESAAVTMTMEKEQTHSFVILTTTPLTISCSSGTGTAVGKMTTEDVMVEKAKVTFTECVVSSDEADCEVATGSIASTELSAPLLLELEEEIAGKPENRLDAKLTGPEGIFATYTIKSKAGHTCLGATTNQKVKGAELCYFLQTGQNVEADELEHLFQCVESSMTVSGTQADLTVEFAIKAAEPNLGDKGSVQENTE
jgi:hypothetical protein